MRLACVDTGKKARSFPKKKKKKNVYKRETAGYSFGFVVIIVTTRG